MKSWVFWIKPLVTMYDRSRCTKLMYRFQVGFLGCHPAPLHSHPVCACIVHNFCNTLASPPIGCVSLEKDEVCRRAWNEIDCGGGEPDGTFGSVGDAFL